MVAAGLDAVVDLEEAVDSANLEEEWEITEAQEVKMIKEMDPEDTKPLEAERKEWEASAKKEAPYLQ